MLQEFKGFVAIPPVPMGSVNNNVIGIATIQSLNATTDRVALIFMISKTGTITKLGFENGTVAGGTGTVTLDVRLETVDPTTGDPTGTLWAANTNGSVVIANTDDNQWQEATLTAGASVTAGEYAAIVINPTNFATVSSIVISGFGSGDYCENNLYSCTNDGGAGYVKNVLPMIAALVYSGDVYEPIKGTLPFSSVTTTTFNSGSSPSRRALKFQLPFMARCCGAWIQMDFDNDLDLKLYAADGSTLLASKAMDATMDATAASAIYQITFNTPVIIAPNINYYLSVEPGASSISVYHWTNESGNAPLDASPGGKNFILATYAGSWSDSSASQPFMGILLDAFSDGTGIIEHRYCLR